MNEKLLDNEILTVFEINFVELLKEMFWQLRTEASQEDNLP